MLLGNYSLNHKLPLVFRGGSTTSVEPQLRSNFNKSGSNRNVFYRSDTTAALSTFAKPTGYFADGGAWVIPQVAGEIGSSVNIVGSTSLSLLLNSGVNLVAAITGTGNITSASGILIIYAAATLVASGAFSSSAFGVASFQANISGAGNIAGNVNGLANAFAALIGASTASGGINAVVSTQAAITGSGAFSGAATGIAQAISNIVASGALSANVFGTISAGGALGGSSALTSNATALAWAIALLLGVGGASVQQKAVGFLNANIRGYGDMTPEGIRDAVWNAIASQFTQIGTMGDLIQNISAGGGATPEQIWEYILVGAGKSARTVLEEQNSKGLTVGKFIALK